jgi:hypothetical protein
MSHKSAPPAVSTMGIDFGKNSFHLVGLDQRGAIVWQLKCSRAQLERRLANIPGCLIGMEACSGAQKQPSTCSLPVRGLKRRGPRRPTDTLQQAVMERS